MNGDETSNIKDDSAPAADGPVDREWVQVADEREAEFPTLGGRYPLSGLLRRARRIAHLSQRELARRAGVAASTVSRVESGAITPTIPAFERLLAVAGLRLVVVDDEGHVITPMRDIPDTRNGGGWRYPSHLDIILDPRPGEWWADSYGLARPPETFHRDHARRLAKQARSKWEVRVAQFRNAPEPPDVDRREMWRARQEQASAKPRPRKVVDSSQFDSDEWSDQDMKDWLDAADDTVSDQAAQARPPDGSPPC